MSLSTAYYHSPVGWLCISVLDGSVRALHWSSSDGHPTIAPNAVARRATDWLDSYFRGTILPISFPLEPAGTPFQRRVWQLVSTIAPASVFSYGDLARDLGSSARAVGQTMAINPIPILIPCHRVTGKRSLGGYSGGGGAATKQWLLEWEQKITAPHQAQQ
ncbi:MAG: methylated-DNA--[protein]-cysteine S-methyltransferase [Magnetococcales bacterium]|nr:methylated-DNA--[protein]-cysteine S-methyltransferase [Magnetococcales bacterium]